MALNVAFTILMASVMLIMIMVLMKSKVRSIDRQRTQSSIVVRILMTWLQTSSAQFVLGPELMVDSEALRQAATEAMAAGGMSLDGLPLMCLLGT